MAGYDHQASIYRDKDGNEFTVNELQTAFMGVAPAKDWKAPISAVIQNERL